MNNNDFIYDQIYKGALKEGAHENSAKNAATFGLSEYKKNRFKSIKVLIDTMIKNAKKRNF
jgi:hypothetical protein